jgi:hypothetical protein
MLHWLRRGQPRREPGATDADNDAVGGRKQSEPVGDWLIDGRKDADYV